MVKSQAYDDLGPLQVNKSEVDHKKNCIKTLFRHVSMRKC